MSTVLNGFHEISGLSQCFSFAKLKATPPCLPSHPLLTSRWGPVRRLEEGTPYPAAGCVSGEVTGGLGAEPVWGPETSGMSVITVTFLSRNITNKCAPLKFLLQLQRYIDE